MVLRSKHPAVITQFHFDRQRADPATDCLDCLCLCVGTDQEASRTPTIDYLTLSDTCIHLKKLNIVLILKLESQSLVPTKKPIGNHQQKCGVKGWSLKRVSGGVPSKRKLTQELGVPIWIIQRGTEEKIPSELKKSQ